LSEHEPSQLSSSDSPGFKEVATADVFSPVSAAGCVFLPRLGFPSPRDGVGCRGYLSMAYAKSPSSSFLMTLIVSLIPVCVNIICIRDILD